jgi:hypothetical protein
VRELFRGAVSRLLCGALVVIFCTPSLILFLAFASVLSQLWFRHSSLETSIEAVNMPVLHRPVVLNMRDSDLLLFAPGQKVPTGQLLPVVQAQ